MSTQPLPRGYTLPPGTRIVETARKPVLRPAFDLAAHDARVLAEREAAAKAEADTVILTTPPPAPTPPPEVSPPLAEVQADDPPPPPEDLTPPADIDLSEFPGAQPTTLSPAQKRAAAKAAQQS